MNAQCFGGSSGAESSRNASAKGSELGSLAAGGGVVARKQPDSTTGALRVARSPVRRSGDKGTAAGYNMLRRENSTMRRSSAGRGGGGRGLSRELMSINEVGDYEYGPHGQLIPVRDARRLEAEASLDSEATAAAMRTFAPGGVGGTNQRSAAAVASVAPPDVTRKSNAGCSCWQTSVRLPPCFACFPHPTGSQCWCEGKRSPEPSPRR